MANRAAALEMVLITRNAACNALDTVAALENDMSMSLKDQLNALRDSRIVRDAALNDAVNALIYLAVQANQVGELDEWLDDAMAMLAAQVGQNPPDATYAESIEIMRRHLTLEAVSRSVNHA